jgi:trehalose synthase-fused probable maltokinase
MIVDAEQLKHQLPDRRWFGGKGRPLRETRVVDETVVEDGPPALVFALIEVAFEDGERNLYHMPLLVDGDGTPRDAFEDIERLRGIGELMAHGHTVKGTDGAFHFGGPGLDPLAPPGRESIRALAVEQSNSSAVLDEEVIVKFFRRVEVGTNPDLELNRLLTNEGFPHIPPQVGEIIYEGEIEGEEISIDLGIAQHFVGDAAEGWSEVLRHVHHVFDEIHPEDAHEDIPTLTQERNADILERLEQLGDVTASLHVTLSREEAEADFTPEPITSGDVSSWVTGVRTSLRALLRSEVEELKPLRAAIDGHIAEFANLDGDLGTKTRIHGDYHLGQVLLVTRDWLIIDFEGEPARPLEQRRTKQPPLRDVAGMLRSFSYAALVPLMERGNSVSESLKPWAEEWEKLARDSFLTGYLRTAHEGRFLPADRDVVMTMLDFFELEKAIYEVGYERGHRPQWAPIPLHGIKMLIERGEYR